MSRPQDSSLAASLAETTRAAIARRDLDTALTLVTRTAVESGLADFCGVTQRLGDGTFETSGATDELVEEADRLQYRLDQGPCVLAAYQDDLLVSPDIRADPRWPEWGPAAAELGIGAAMSVHLFTDQGALGALNLYWAGVQGDTEDARNLARLIATHASIALAYFRGEQHLWKAIDARHRIGQAQGVLMERYGIEAERAFDLMRRLSQQGNTKLHLLADQIVRHREVPGLSPRGEPAVPDPAED